MQKVNVRHLKFSNHAVKQFKRRYLKIYPQCKKNLDGAMLELARKARATPVNLRHFQKRDQQYGTDTDYYTTQCGWRFVVVYDQEQDETTVVTIERMSPDQNI